MKRQKVDPTYNVNEDDNDAEIHNYEKLDKILSGLCQMVTDGQESEKDYGMVAAAVLDPDNRMVARLNRPGKNGKRIHAEHAAIIGYTKQHGDIPEGSIILTTLSPCNEAMDERDGPSCTDLINSTIVKKVYCGYIDPTQGNDSRQFNLMETGDKQIRIQCKEFADTFLGHVDESVGSEKDYLSQVSNLSWKPVNRSVWNTIQDEGLDEEQDAPNHTDWAMASLTIDPKDAQALQAFDNDAVEDFNRFDIQLKDRYPGLTDLIDYDRGTVTIVKPINQGIDENFADGKNPQDKGDSKRYGVPTKASISTLRKFAKKHSGRAAQLAHWAANMKSGKCK